MDSFRTREIGGGRRVLATNGSQSPTMTDAIEIPGIANLTELGRLSDLITFRGEMDDTEVSVEYLSEPSPEGLSHFFRTTALQSRLGHPGM